MYECKTYSLLKDVDASSRDSKLKSRVFVDYLIDYNSINVFRVWNSGKEDVNDYRDVIFDESELYDMYNKNDSLVTLEKESQIELKKKKRTVKISINQRLNWIARTTSDSTSRSEIDSYSRISDLWIQVSKRIVKQTISNQSMILFNCSSTSKHLISRSRSKRLFFMIHLLNIHFFQNHHLFRNRHHWALKRDSLTKNLRKENHQMLIQ